MHGIDNKKIITLKISPKLPRFVRKRFQGNDGFLSRISVHGKDLLKNIPDISLSLIPLTDDLIKKHTSNTQKIDCFYNFFDGGFYEKAKYKFSSWESMILGLNESMDSVTYAVRGDFFSQWVWPHRTLGNLVRLLFTHWRVMPVHAGAFANDNGATLMLAPSGTGKTLTIINWLCRNNQFYSDDQSYIYDGHVLPLARHISYWSHRYKGNSDAIPPTMPPLQYAEQKRLRNAKILRMLSFGHVGFGASLDVEKYWPGSVATPKPVTKIIILQKADSFSIEEHASTTEAINKIMGDFRFQTLPILRWVECARLTKKNVFLTEWEHKCRNMIVKLVNNSQLIKVNIPSVYSQDIYSKLENVIK